MITYRERRKIWGARLSKLDRQGTIKLLPQKEQRDLALIRDYYFGDLGFEKIASMYGYKGKSSLIVAVMNINKKWLNK